MPHYSTGCLFVGGNKGKEMLTWKGFVEVRPDLAASGRRLLYQYGVGLAFLATVRKDGGPRLHPVCPILHQDQLYCFVLGASPKRWDLLRDGRYALHAFLPAHEDEEFYCRGKAIFVPMLESVRL